MGVILIRSKSEIYCFIKVNFLVLSSWNDVIFKTIPLTLTGIEEIKTKNGFQRTKYCGLFFT